MIRKILDRLHDLFGNHIRILSDWYSRIQSWLFLKKCTLSRTKEAQLIMKAPFLQSILVTLTAIGNQITRISVFLYISSLLQYEKYHVYQSTTELSKSFCLLNFTHMMYVIFL